MTLRQRLMLVYIMVALLSAVAAGVAAFELQHAHAIMGELQKWHDIVLNIEQLKSRWRPPSDTQPDDWNLKDELARQFVVLGRIAAGEPVEKGAPTGADQYPVADMVRLVLNDVYRKYDQWLSLPAAERPKQTNLVGDALAQLSVELKFELSKINRRADSQAIRARVLLSLVMVLTLLHIAVIGMLLKRWLLRPLERLNRQVVALGRDEAPGEPLLASPREFATLATALDRARQSLGAVRQQLIDAERLTTIGQMAAQLAHNLRNPLASIRAAAQLTSRQNQVAGPFQQRMSDIIASVDRLNRWVLGLMEVARRDPTLTQDADVLPTVQRAVDAVHEELAAKELTLRLEAPSQGLVCAHDPTTLEHALIAMLVNAVEASPLGSELGVQVARVETEADPLCRVSVKDNGVGLPAEDPERIFEFSYSTKQKGMGLGLALARQALKRQGGNTRAFNNPDGGATVCIELPIRLTPETDAADPTPQDDASVVTSQASWPVLGPEATGSIGSTDPHAQSADR